MKMLSIVVGLTFVGAAAIGCSSAAVDAPESAGAPQLTVASKGVANVCWDGIVLPRPAQDPIPTAAVTATYTAFATATAAYTAAAAQWQLDYEAALAAQQDALENHPDYIAYKALYPEYVAALNVVVGKACTVDSECVSPSATFPGLCHIYYQHGQCTVDSTQLPPIPQIPLNFSTPAPTPPVQPVFTCADFTCAANYACELEVATSGIACVENRCPVGGGHGGRP